MGHPNFSLYASALSYEKRRMLERDRVTTKEIEKDIKDGIRDKFIQANKQREV